MQNKIFVWPVRVYIEDTDAGGIVYHANYLHYLERARSEWLRSQGFEQAQLQTCHGIQFVVYKLSLTYQKPAYLDNLLELKLNLTGLRKTGMQLLQTIEYNEQLLLQAQVEIACTDVTGRPTAMPTALFTSLQQLIC